MNIIAFLGPIGPPELLIIFFLILLIFGPRKLPELAEALGKSLQKFKRASKEVREEIETDLDDDTKKKE